MNNIIKNCKIHGDLTIEQTRSWKYKNMTITKCRQCELIRSRIYNKKAADKKREYDKNKWATRKEQIKAYRITDEFKQKRNQYMRARYQKNKETLKKYNALR